MRSLDFDAITKVRRAAGGGMVGARPGRASLRAGKGISGAGQGGGP